MCFVDNLLNTDNKCFEQSEQTKKKSDRFEYVSVAQWVKYKTGNTFEIQ